MAQVLKKRRLVNPGGRRRRRNMTAKQIKYFGTARQKAGLKNRRRRNLGPRHGARRRNQHDAVSQVERTAERAIDRIEHMAEDALGSVAHVIPNRGRRRNVGEILTVLPANPGRRKRRKRTMAATRTRNRRRRANRTHNRGRRRTNRARARVTNRRHRNRTRRTANPRVIVRYRNRRRNRRTMNRRRNPDFLSGEVGRLVSLVGGAALTGIITGFLPSTITTGVMGMLTTSVAAVVGGQVAGKMTRNKNVAIYYTTGGLLIVALQLIQQFFPQLNLPISLSTPAAGTSGMGLISSSNFYVPQVNQPGSMASFVLPAAIPTVAVPAASSGGGTGMGQIRSMRRIGRLR